MAAPLDCCTPSKPFEVIVYDSDSDEEKLVTYGCDLPELQEDFREAIKIAQKDKRKDGHSRFIYIRQVLQRCSI